MLAFARAYPQATFIQIGSNDGLQQDPLHDAIQKSAWSGVMVEPVPYVFERLFNRYNTCERLALENVAISQEEGVMPFYHLPQASPDEELPSWYDGLGSFSREILLRHAKFIPDIESRIVCSEVPCLTFESLCSKHDIKTVDVLHIDTEGYDFEIIKQIDFSTLKPRLVIYEHHHLSSTDRKQCMLLLQSAGYDLNEEGLDTWGVQSQLLSERLWKKWGRLKARRQRLLESFA
nr:FkbM family methyltransferase [Oceanococcus sp. HetDA_MAG_MS8]